jgi:serine/threonine-protein kinase
MAPEQLAGEGVDGRSDLFSLGVILYAMVTGHSPFQGNSATTVCFKVANREPLAASALDLNLPHELDEVISRAMAKDPEQRYQRGAEFADDIRQLQQLFKPGSTTTRLRSVASTGTRSTGTRSATASRTNPVAEMAQAESLVRAVVRKAPMRDLILGAATLVVLVFVGAQTKLLVIPSKELTPIAASVATPPPSSEQPNAAATVKEAIQPAPAPPTLPKTHGSTSQAPKQIVVPTSTLELAVQHQFKEATLFVWVDDKLSLTRPLHGGTQKRLVVFNGVRGVDSETMKIPAGKHVLRVRALSSDETIDLSRTISSEFLGGGEKSLQVTFDKHNTVMRLSWQ